MLVLSRKVNEVVYVGDDIKVTVVKMQNGVVRLGFRTRYTRIPRRQRPSSASRRCAAYHSRTCLSVNPGTPRVEW